MSDNQQAAGQENTASPAQGEGQASATDATLLGGQPSDKPAEGAQTNADAAKQGDPAGDGNANPDAKPGDGEKPDDGDGKDGKDGDEGAPEKYELKAPEGFEQLDAQLVETFEPLARELKLTNEGAQKLVETMMPKVVERIAEQNRAAWTGQLEAWVSDVKNDKELGGDALAGNLEAARRALDQFATDELRALIGYPSAENPRGLGLGNHPELVRVFARIGKAMAEDAIVTGGNPAGAQRTAAEILYGKPSQ